MVDKFYDLIKAQADLDPSFRSLTRKTAGNIERRTSEETRSNHHPALGEPRYSFQVQAFSNGLLISSAEDEMSREELVEHLDEVRAYLANLE